MTPAEFYRNKRNDVSDKLNETQKKINRNTTYRLVFFLSMLGFLFGLSQVHLLIGVVLAIVALVVFAVLVRYHLKLQQTKKYFQSELLIVEQELEAINHVFSSFRSGAEYINPQHRYSYDLDLFGQGSLFQMINRTITQSGEIVLAKHIGREYLNDSDIISIQESVKELSAKGELMLHYRTTGSLTEIVSEDKKKIDGWRNSESYVSGKTWIMVARYALPLFTWLALLMLTLTGEGTLFILFFLLNLIITGWFYKASNKEHNKVSSFYNVLQKYQHLLQIFEKETFKSKKLEVLSEQINNNEGSASGALKDLTKALSAFDNRLNAVAAIFLHGLFLYDFQCLLRIEKWRKTYQSQLPIWLDNIAEFDSLVSLATFAFNNPEFVYPVPTKETVLSAKQVGHPFLPSSVRVANNFSIKNKGEFVIVTGANMAGKSTFLRTVGVNLVLAMAGMPVCAESFSFTPRKLYSSMRTSDSLNENESYFYAELKRMKNLIDMLEDGEDLFILLDEILKGTNSVDKQKGSQLALKKIIQLKGSGIIATHDLALTEMENEFHGVIRNQCFEIEIDNAKIEFDYKLYDGVTQKMNAMLLMQQMGIIEKQ